MDPGTWTDHGQVFRSTTGNAYNAIDANLVVDENGTPVLSFGEMHITKGPRTMHSTLHRFILGRPFRVRTRRRDVLTHNRATCIKSTLGVTSRASQPRRSRCRLTLRRRSLKRVPSSGSTEATTIYSSAAVSRPDTRRPHTILTAPLSGLCCGFSASALPPAGNEYKVFVGRSTSAHGPFLDKSGKDLRSTGGTLVLASHGNVYAPGGQAVFTDSKSGKDIFVYHYIPVSSPVPYSDAYASLGLNAIDWSSVSMRVYLSFMVLLCRTSTDADAFASGMAGVEEHLIWLR